MPRYSGHKRGAHSSDNGSFWISFSDLMSAIVLVFVLILFYCMYQYFDMLEVKTAELLRQSGLLDEQQAALNQSEEDLQLTQQELEQKQAELEAQSQKLSEAEEASLAQQAKLLLQEQTLAELEAQLALQESQLAEQESKLAAQENQLAQQQASLNAAILQQQATQQQLETQQAQLATQQQQLDKLVGVRADLIHDLIAALEASDITGASVDDSGAIVFDSSMMFDSSRYTLKNVGKDFLNSFIPNYLSVLMSEQYAPYVSQIIIEGHTDTNGSFLYNMELSQNRAYAVLDYILSDSFKGITNAAKDRLQEIVTVNGRSYSDLIYRADGSVDMAASRRVVIKFRMNDEDMVNQMLELLNQGE